MTRDSLAEHFYYIGCTLTHHDASSGSVAVGCRRFRALFGVTHFVCSDVWRRLHESQSMPHGGKPVHLLWACLFLKRYATGSENRAITGADEKTVRKWTWAFIKAIAHLPDIVSTSDAHI